MYLNLYLPISSFFIVVLIMIIFFSKERVNTAETKVFSILTVVTLFGVSLDTWLIYYNYITPHSQVLHFMVNFYSILVLLWIATFAMYIFHISLADRLKSYVKTIYLGNGLIVIFAMLLIFILPVHLYDDRVYFYIFGPSVNFLIIMCGIYAFLITSMILLNIKSIINRKYLPVFALVFMMLVAFVVRGINPGIPLTSPILTYITLIMFFTIENPDVKINRKLDEANKLIKKQQGQMMHQTEMATLGGLAGGMVHDINTPIATILNGMQFLKSNDRIPKDEETERIWRNMDISVKKIISTTESMRNQIRNLGIKETEDFSIKDIIREIEKNHRFLDSKCKLETEIIEDIIIHGERTKLHHVLDNIITNSLQAYQNQEKDGIVRIKLHQKDGYSIIEISDDAGGVPERIKDDMFKKILTTKGTTGTGIGLFVSDAIIKGVFDGEIEVETKLDEGSTFVIKIPIKKED